MLIARVDIVRVAIRVFCACRVVVHLPVCLHLREKKLNTTKQKDNHKKERYSNFCARRRARRSLLPRTSTCAKEENQKNNKEERQED
jgi:methyltransferase-like protein